jgi:hypothetical protein
MRFRQWYSWVLSKPWSLRWFILLIIIRPFVDNLYSLKYISPFLSPLFWIGAITPLLCIYPIIKRSYYKTRINRFFNVWAVIILLNSLFLVLLPQEILYQLQWILRITMPIYLFAFLRVFIRSKPDLTGLLTTFIYASAVASIMLLYELIFQPIKIVYSRGIERIQGGYADVMSYAVYLSFGLLIIMYFFIVNRYRAGGLKIGLTGLIAVMAFVISGFVGISHVASYMVFIALVLLFVLYAVRRFSLASVTLILFLWIGISFLGQSFFQSKIDPLFKNEIEIVQGSRSETQLFHGRMTRWQTGWDNFKGSPVYSWIVGFPTSMKDPLFNISISIHNDYLRIFFLTGIFGIIFYFLFIINLWRQIRFLHLPEKLLLSGAIIILLIYSVSTTPTLYANFLYILFSIMVYFSLPAHRLILNEEI